MFFDRPIAELNQRKRLLIAEAEQHREVLRAECANIAARVSELGGTIDTVRNISPWIAAGEAGLDILVGKRWRKWGRWILLAFSAFKWIREFRERRAR